MPFVTATTTHTTRGRRQVNILLRHGTRHAMRHGRWGTLITWWLLYACHQRHKNAQHLSDVRVHVCKGVLPSTCHGGLGIHMQSINSAILWVLFVRVIVYCLEREPNRCTLSYDHYCTHINEGFLPSPSWRRCCTCARTLLLRSITLLFVAPQHTHTRSTPSMTKRNITSATSTTLVYGTKTRRGKKNVVRSAPTAEVRSSLWIPKVYNNLKEYISFPAGS